MDAIQVATPEEFGAAIRRLRRRRGWTQADLAEWLGVNRATVRHLERGEGVSMTTGIRAMSVMGAKAVVVPKTYAIVATRDETDD